MPDDKNNLEQRDFFVQEWLKRVADDELNVRAILKDRDGTPAQVCFLSQQMAEKSLKALVLHHTGDYPKIHGLSQLAVMLGEYIKGASDELKDDVTLLNPYYVGTRYVADIPLESFTWSMAEDAFAAALRIKEFVLTRTKSSAESGFGAIGVVVMAAILIILAGVGYFAYQRIAKIEAPPINSFEDCEEAGYPVAGGVTPSFCVAPDGRRFMEKVDRGDRACTQEAKLCPDGSYVSRTGSMCKFAACPQEFDIIFDQVAEDFCGPQPPATCASNKRLGCYKEIKHWDCYPVFEEVDISNWKTYRNEEYGFEVKYPTDWFAIEDSRGINFTPLSPDDPLQASSIGLASSMTIQRKDDSVQNRIAEYMEQDGFAQNEIIVSSNLTAVRTTYIGGYAGETHVAVLIPRGSTLFEIHYVSSDQWSVPEGILSTFKLVK